MADKIEIKCPRCGRGLNRHTQNPSPVVSMSGLTCSPCRIHFDIQIARDGKYEYKRIR